MRRALCVLVVGVVMNSLLLSTCSAKSLKFAGRQWTVRGTGDGGPGPNHWSDKNVFVDAEGLLHLKLTRQQDRWECAEAFTDERLGFGSYQFQVIGRVDQLDPNIVLGLFNYPTADVGPDSTNEIDIEFSRWGKADGPPGSYAVYPAKAGVPHKSQTFPIKLSGDYSTHRFQWRSNRIDFLSLHGHRDDNKLEFARWSLQPKDPREAVGQQPMPVHINLWCFQGKPPQNGKEVELVIKSFKFVK